jgi:hypothetical protein
VIHSEEAVCDVPPCGVPDEVRLTALSRDSEGVSLEWVPDPLCLNVRVWRSADPGDAGFLDGSAEPLLFWIIQGHGPDGDGPWGHYEK